MEPDDDFKTSTLSRWPPNVGNKCVAVKRTATDVQVRETKVVNGHVLSFTHEEWSAFIDGVHLNEFDL
jgi:hypothetical protein